MPDSLPAPDLLADAARTLDEAVARLERASDARPTLDRAALAEATARIDALILRLNDAAAKTGG
jgi:hypothetical protein